jgi:hypothetical protein
MIFTKQIITPIFTEVERITSEISVTQLKNAKIERGNSCDFFIQNFSDNEIRQFKEYWSIIRPIFDLDKIFEGTYQLRWQGYSGSELYELILDSKTGHRITFGFYPIAKEFDVYYYNQKNQILHTDFIMGKTKNLRNSERLKKILLLFQR